ncbi:hypothetical protein DH2020_029010 [Rehmannia glutinosa]|uniref:DCD domain-containing protein n=1 Tax=Rehmannia glutinosa TaxID=99300 RepID=A0ABR0VPU9_REHGL
MENNNQSSFWQFSDNLRLHTNNLANLSLNDSIWSNNYAAKRPPRSAATSISGTAAMEDLISAVRYSKGKGFANNVVVNGKVNKGGRNEEEHGGKIGKKNRGNKESNKDNNNNGNGENKTAVDKRFKTLPPAESLPRNETIGGYIFVCNNDTMAENLKRQLLVCLPPRYRDSVRAITPGLPLFLYNYSTHQLHGIFEAASFGGTNIDPSAWEDKKNPGESRFPAQVRVVTRKICEPLEEDSFRPILHHYDGPKFRLELNIPETLRMFVIVVEPTPCNGLQNNSIIIVLPLLENFQNCYGLHETRVQQYE